MAKKVLKLPILEKPLLAPQAKILLVEDDLKNLEHYCAVLRQHGYVVWPIASYTEGAACAKKLDASLVIVGQGSPAFEGRCVVESAIARDRHLPVVVVARCVDMGCYLEAMQLGAVDYLEKPQEPAEILELARRHLQPPAQSVRVPLATPASQARGGVEDFTKQRPTNTQATIEGPLRGCRVVADWLVADGCGYREMFVLKGGESHD
jgi:DNA-binding NtrC family response regulator